MAISLGLIAFPFFILRFSRLFCREEMSGPGYLRVFAFIFICTRCVQVFAWFVTMARQRVRLIAFLAAAAAAAEQ